VGWTIFCGMFFVFMLVGLGMNPIFNDYPINILGHWFLSISRESRTMKRRIGCYTKYVEGGTLDCS
jgi:hypothetical protein